MIEASLVFVRFHHVHHSTCSKCSVYTWCYLVKSAVLLIGDVLPPGYKLNWPSMPVCHCIHIYQCKREGLSCKIEYFCVFAHKFYWPKITVLCFFPESGISHLTLLIVQHKNMEMWWCSHYVCYLMRERMALMPTIEAKLWFPFLHVKRFLKLDNTFLNDPSYYTPTCSTYYFALPV